MSEAQAPDAEPALHLRASAGDPLDASADWSRVNGTFHRISLASSLKIAHIARTGEPVRIDRLSEDARWIRFPEWVERERLVGFAGRPLIFRGEVLGVLGAFRRVELSDECWAWLQALSDAAAVAVANARAFEEAEALRRALELERDYLREELQESGAFGDILGRSAALARVLHEVDTVAATDTNVLILGESGTGKELIARAIHQRSRRAARSLVKVNCGSIPRELFESEFFGHVRGSFTGAVRDRTGRFQLADGGTLFLDEVGEIPLDLQVKLLRVLQEGEFERVGDDATRRVNVRVVAATNRDLAEGSGRAPVPARPVLPAGRLSDFGAAASRPPRGHPGSDRTLRQTELRTASRRRAQAAVAGDRSRACLRLAGQRARAAERRRARRHPRARRHVGTATARGWHQSRRRTCGNRDDRAAWRSFQSAVGAISSEPMFCAR